MGCRREVSCTALGCLRSLSLRSLTFCRSAPIGRVIFEIGGPVDIRPEVAKEGACTAVHVSSLLTHSAALRLASAKLPVPTEFIDASAGPRLGSLSEVLPPASAAARSGAGIVVPAGAPVPPA